MLMGGRGSVEAALRSKLEDQSAEHAKVVSGLSAEVKRLQTVTHSLMLQLVMAGVMPQVPTDRAFVESIYQQVLQSLRRGEVQLPDALPSEPDERVNSTIQSRDDVGLSSPGAVDASVSAPEAAKAATAHANQSAMAVAPSTPPPLPASAHARNASPHSSGSSRPGLLGHASLPPIGRDEAAAAWSPSSPSCSHSAAAASPLVSRVLVGVAAHAASAPVGTRHRPARQQPAVDGMGGAQRGADGGEGGGEEDSNGCETTDELRPLSKSPSPADVPRLLRKGGGSYNVRKPRNLVPLHVTERSAIGGFGVRTARRDKPKQQEAEQAGWTVQPSLGYLGDDR